MGLADVASSCNRLSHLGEAYRPSEGMREMARRGERFHGP